MFYRNIYCIFKKYFQSKDARSPWYICVSESLELNCWFSFLGQLYPHVFASHRIFAVSMS